MVAGARGRGRRGGRGRTGGNRGRQGGRGADVDGHRGADVDGRRGKEVLPDAALDANELSWLSHNPAWTGENLRSSAWDMAFEARNVLSDSPQFWHSGRSEGPRGHIIFDFGVDGITLSKIRLSQPQNKSVNEWDGAEIKHFELFESAWTTDRGGRRFGDARQNRKAPKSSRSPTQLRRGTHNSGSCRTTDIRTSP